MSLTRRLIEHFVMPVDCVRPVAREEVSSPGGVPYVPDPDARRPAGVVALTSSTDVAALGAALGLALASAHRAPVAVVCVWSGEEATVPARRGPAVPAARRLATTLTARGLHAWPAGRLVLVRLAGCDDDAALEGRRALAAAGAAPSVLALGGPRSPVFDEVLADQDLVVVGTRSGTDAVLTRLAVAGLAGAARACACEIPAGSGARSLALAGLALAPSARRALAAPLAELS